jgi:hydrogenase maturation protein HypF
MNTWHIHIEGRVQGVGMRPTIYRVAKELGINGTVANTKNGVHLFVNADAEGANLFIQAIQNTKPAAAEIVEITKTKVADRTFDDFSIIESGNGQRPKLLVTPDIGLCDACRNDLQEPTNPRHNYAFTTCTNCGPRYSIATGLPYDRETTTMAAFKMCPECNKEYHSVTDRRFYSQTNSCPKCGVKLIWLTPDVAAHDAIAHVVSLLKKGKTVAVKGIGGFLLLTDATNETAVKTLRERKKRPTKPFALLFPNLETLSRYVRISHLEQKALESAQSPIVLLNLQKTTPKLALQAIAPGLNRIGAMLPYAPVLERIAAMFAKPLVATSANVSGSPIIYKDSEAMRLLPTIADAILSNNREITFPQDDSVVQFSASHQKKIMLRRSRGYAPSISWPANRLADDMLAFGAEMKSAFGFTSMGNTYLSQFLGDTSTYESQVAYNDVFVKLRELLNPETKTVFIDAHPDYTTSQVGRNWARYHSVPLKKVQHHHAHFAAVLAEHDLLKSPEPVLGVIWDGTGYGANGQLWGSEFFSYENGKMTRENHLMPYPHVFNNRMAMEPKLSAMAILHPVSPGKVWIRHHFTEHEQELLEHALANPKITTTSMGRLFDATAAILGVANQNSYEGESALALQVLAESSTLRNWKPLCLPVEGHMLDASALLEIILGESREGQSAADLAMRFHQTLVQWIAWVADTAQIKKVAFSGGVFQNSLLVDLIIDRMKDSHELYFHDLLPPNDENIAIGQMAMMQIEVVPEDAKKYQHQNTQRVCV